MTTETESIIRYIERRADAHQQRGTAAGPVQDEHRATAADFRALASDLKAGLHHG